MPKRGVPAGSATALAPAEKAFVDSLHSFLREELKARHADGQLGAGGQPGHDTLDLSPWQAVSLLALAFNVTLVYLFVISMIPGGEDNRVLVFLQKLLPALGGTLAVSYFDRLRGWLFNHSKNKWFGITSLVLLPLLLVRQAPIYSVFVQVEPPYSTVELDGNTARFNNQRNFLLVKVQSHHITVQDGHNPKFEYRIGAGRVFEGTIARLPYLNHVFAPLKLAAAYQVEISFEDEHGQLFISAPLGLPLENSNSGLVRVTSALSDLCPPAKECWTKMVSQTLDFINLPAGSGDVKLLV